MRVRNTLEAILHFLGVSISSGITWDLLKGSGERLIYSFKRNLLTINISVMSLNVMSF